MGRAKVLPACAKRFVQHEHEQQGPRQLQDCSDIAVSCWRAYPKMLQSCEALQTGWISLCSQGNTQISVG